jgi:hypothetical protein
MYLDVGRLDAWEAASQAILPDDDQTAADELLLEVWDFGRFNLYAAFEQVATNNQYTKLRALLAKHGIDSEEAPDLSGW